MGVINSHNPSNSQHAEHHVLETDGHISEQSRDGGNADHSQSGTSSLFRLLNNLNLVGPRYILLNIRSVESAGVAFVKGANVRN